MNMSITTISRKEHKQMSNPYLPTAISTSKKDESKKRDKYLPAGKSSPSLANTAEAERRERKNESPKEVGEEGQGYMKENDDLDETQMTDLPPDDTMLSFDESFVKKEETQQKENK